MKFMCVLRGVARMLVKGFTLQQTSKPSHGYIFIYRISSRTSTLMISSLNFLRLTEKLKFEFIYYSRSFNDSLNTEYLRICRQAIRTLFFPLCFSFSILYSAINLVIFFLHGLILDFTQMVEFDTTGYYYC